MSVAPDPALLAKLVCPVTRTPLRWDADRGELVSEAAGLAFPVRDGVPVMVVREARPLR
ncbi:MAG TPA: Trm112 family protein [Sphingobium sp.]|nr:Trm112 family protein [Sphingobium sp.]